MDLPWHFGVWLVIAFVLTAAVWWALGEQGKRRTGILLAAGLALLGIVTCGLIRGAEGDGADCGFAQAQGNLASVQPVLWEPTDPRSNTRIAIAMDDRVDEARSESLFVPLRATRANRGRASALRGPNVKIGAFVLGTLSDGRRGIGFPVLAKAERSRDGRGVNVTVCAARSKPRTDSRAGTYKGTVRVAGRNIAPADVPVEVTVKAARTELILFAVFVALLGSALSAVTAWRAKQEDEQDPKHKRVDLLLAVLPFIGGLVAGIVAAFVVYADDPTFGAQRGQDMAKLLTVTFAAATGGLAVTAPPAAAARSRMPRA